MSIQDEIRKDLVAVSVGQYNRLTLDWSPFSKGYSVVSLTPEGKPISVISYDGRGRPTEYLVPKEWLKPNV